MDSVEVMQDGDGPTHRATSPEMERVIREETRRDQEAKWKNEAKAYADTKAHEIANSELVVRKIIALVLVGAVIIGVLGGVFLRVPTDQLAAYLGPVTGLAGLAIGYFFGSSERNKSSQPGSRD